MLGHNFYFGLISKYSAIIGTLFNDLYITRTDKTDDSNNQIIRIPLTYAPKDKVLVRWEQDPGINNEFAMKSPMIAYEWVDMQYSPSRKLNTLDRYSIVHTDKSKKKFQYNPVAYDFNYIVSIYVKNRSDGLKIIEQILPFFTPDITLSVDLIPELGLLNEDISVVFNGIQMEDLYEGDFKERKVLKFDISLTLKGYLFGPIRDQKIIKFVNTNLYIPQDIENTNGTLRKVNILNTPGLTANGSPTTDSSISISPNEISITDDYGFCVEITEE